MTPFDVDVAVAVAAAAAATLFLLLLKFFGQLALYKLALLFCVRLREL
jgi:hypothetical protein